jgi:hypothetical protein
MKFPRKVYCIRHNPTERVYIGSSANADRRIGAHISALRRGSHINEDMQADYNRHGEDYTITILDSIENMSEVEKEYEWMKMYESNVRGKGYNYNDPKKMGGGKKKKLSPEEELIELIRSNENPEKAMLVAVNIISGLLLTKDI